jgi:DNA-binding Lrp family transcriptional regulator
MQHVQHVSDTDTQLTEFDRRLIAELQSDGRMPYNALADVLGVSEATVQRRTQQLIEQGYFKIVGTVDPIHSGHGHAVMVALRCDPQAIHQVTDAVAAIPQIRFLALVTGTYDIVCELVTFDRQSTTAILTGTLSLIPGIRAVNTSWVLENYKTNFRWDALRAGTNGAHAPSTTGTRSSEYVELALDELDDRIVDLLASNGRASYAQIAADLGTTVSTARRHALRLIQSGYVNVVALGNPFRLGFDEVVLLWLKVDMARTAQVLRALEGEKAVRYLSRVAGEADVLAEAFFPHRTDLLSFLNGPLAAIDGIKEAALSFELLIRKRGYMLFE